MSSGFRRWLVPVVSLLALVACGPEPAESELDYQRGRNALAAGRPEWARVYFAADLEAHPERLESWRGLGLAWSSGSEGSFSKAIDAFETYLEQSPGDDEIRLRLARCRYRIRDVAGALEALAGLEGSVEGSVLAARLYRDREPEVALEHLQVALRQAPHELAPRLLAAQLHARLGEPERVVEQAAAAIAIDPLHAEASYLLATASGQLGQEEAARKAFERHRASRWLAAGEMTLDEQIALLTGEPGGLAARPRARLARAHLAAGQPQRAADVARQLAADVDVGAGLLFDLAQAFHRAGRTLVARELATAVLDRHSEHLGALTLQAEVARQTGDFDAARRWLAAGLAVDPESAPLHHIQGMIALSEQRAAEGAAALRLAVELAPWSARYRLALAEVWLAAGERESLVALLSAAPVADPALETFRQKHQL
ncbi:MAG: tetratricopeptide repeat protein [Acidobacteriota bacterium]